MEHGNSNQDVAYLLRCVAASYSIRGIDKFRIIAYQRASEVIEHMSSQLYDLFKDNNMKNVDGLGKILIERIEDYFTNKESSFLITEYKKTPENVYQLMKVPGIGVKTADRLVTEFGLENSKDIYDDVLKLCLSNSISVLSGFGAKSQADILDGIKTLGSAKFNDSRLRIDVAMAVYDQIREYLLKHNSVVDTYPVGSLRRFSSTVGDVDIVAVCPESTFVDIINYFVEYPGTKIIEGKGPHKGAIILTSGVHVQLRTIEPDKLGAMLQYNTGSKEHNIQLRTYALRKKMSISEYGITLVTSDKKQETSDKTEGDKVYFDSEEKFYNYLGLQYIPPELRQGGDEIELAKRNALPQLVELSDIKGDLQMHTNYPIEPSHDLGASSCTELLEDADRLKYEYIAFTDHNPSISNHTDTQVIDILRARRQEIDRMLSNKLQRTNYFLSLEVDIRPDGTIAVPDNGLDYVDFILISIHSSFKQTRSEMTSRILRAMENRKVKVLAHPTGRLIGSREGVDADWTEIFKVAKSKNIALEINGAPERLDLPDNLIIDAKKIGCKFSLGTDSHHRDALANMKYAISLARRGGLDKHDIINTMDYESIKSYLLK